MKKILFFFAFLLSFDAYSQAPIMDSTWLPRAGDKFFIQRIGYIDTIRAKDTGANIVWDYSKALFSPDYPEDSSNYASPKQSSFNCDDPNVNLIDTFHAREHYCLIKDTSGIWETEYGYAAKDSSVWGRETYIKPLKWRRSNWRFRQEYRDTAEHNDVYKDKPGDSVDRITEYNWSRYDGYGTLKLGKKTYTSAVRVHKTILTRDSLYYDSSYHVYYYFDDSYEWYTSSQRDFVLKTYLSCDLKKNTSGFDTTDKRYKAIFQELPHSLSLAPISSPWKNVTTAMNNNTIRIMGIADDKKEIQYQLYDIQGKLIDEGSFTPTASAVSIPIPTVSTGVYLFRIKANGQDKTFKLIKN